MITLKEAKRLAKRRSPQDVERLRAEATLQNARLVEVKNRDEGYAVQEQERIEAVRAARAGIRLERRGVGDKMVERAHKRLRALPPGNRTLRRALNRGANRTPILRGNVGAVAYEARLPSQVAIETK